MTDLLIAVKIQETTSKLYLRIKDRFPDSGLLNTCQKLIDIAKESDKTLLWISRPNYLLRSIIYSLIVFLVSVIIYSICQLNLKADGINIADFIQMTEAGLNEIIIIGAGIAFLVTFENKKKRERVIRAINRLRCLSHVIDAHQLTKDPDTVMTISVPTVNSPKRKLNVYELGRYLDYCSEMLSLVSKIGFLYVQNFDDPTANNAVNDLESLTTGLCRKIWQKIIILRSMRSS
ncbi:MAG: hypothetical protein JW867_03535 [Candidatus Omnitrophica bacterium]|nr:hypothetical protein [Candidatus Omnitrophota bacterium]